MRVHQKESKLAGKTVKIKEDIEHPQVEDFGGSNFVVEDWWDRLGQGSWMHCYNRIPACMIYSIRSISNELPVDDEVLYGKIGFFGHLVHISEIEKNGENHDT